MSYGDLSTFESLFACKVIVLKKLGYVAIRHSSMKFVISFGCSILLGSKHTLFYIESLKKVLFPDYWFFHPALVKNIYFIYYVLGNY